MGIEVSVSGYKSDNTKDISIRLRYEGMPARMQFELSNPSPDPLELDNQIREEAIRILLTLKSEVEMQLPLRG